MSRSIACDAAKFSVDLIRKRAKQQFLVYRAQEM